MDENFQAACAFARDFVGGDAPIFSSEVYARKLEAQIFGIINQIDISESLSEEQTLLLAQMAHDGDALAFDALLNFCLMQLSSLEEIDLNCRLFMAGVLSGRQKRPRRKPALRMIRDIAIIGVIQEIVARYAIHPQRGDETGQPCAVDAIASISMLTPVAIDGIYSQRNTPRSAWHKVVALPDQNLGITIKSASGRMLTINCK